MLYALIGLVAAMLFGVGAAATYGTEELMTLPWVETVFWSLIGAGVAVGYIDTFVRCLICRHAEKHSVLCRNAHCH